MFLVGREDLLVNIHRKTATVTKRVKTEEPDMSYPPPLHLLNPSADGPNIQQTVHVLRESIFRLEQTVRPPPTPSSPVLFLSAAYLFFCSIPQFSLPELVIVGPSCPATGGAQPSHPHPRSPQPALRDRTPPPNSALSHVARPASLHFTAPPNVGRGGGSSSRRSGRVAGRV
jgi:hypothetical protein